MSNILNNLWNNWKNNEGLCKYCPNNDTNNYWHPLFFGNKNAKIMIIAETPAYNIENYEFRTCKNYCEYNNIELSLDEMLIKFLENRFNSSKNWLSYIIKILLHRSSFTKDDIYFTNIKKCGDIKNKKKDFQAYDICKNYIEDEINYINPKIVIVIGKKVWICINEIFNFNNNLSILKEHKNIYEKNNRKFLIFGHWGYFRKQGKINQYKIDIYRRFQDVRKNI